MKRKYFDTKAKAKKERDLRDKDGTQGLHVYKMPRGTRHAGKYAVCDYMEWLNTY